MAANAKLFTRYIWLTELIYSAGRITREEIDHRWEVCSLNEEHSSTIPERTFHRWKNEVQELFHINIACYKPTNTYYIDNNQDLGNSQMLQWLLHTFAVTNIVNESEQMREHILLESMPSDSRFLAPIVEAIRLGRVLEVAYQKFGAPLPHTFTMQPYCVKVFKQRWYMVGLSSDHPDEIRVYALDRIQSIHITDQPYAIPDDFNGKEYFKHSYGVIVGDKKPEKIVIQVAAKDADYIRSLPLHASQKEVQRNSSYSTFEYFVAATIDFQQELLTHGANLIVQQPLWLANRFHDIGRETMLQYQDKPFQ